MASDSGQTTRLASRLRHCVPATSAPHRVATLSSALYFAVAFRRLFSCLSKMNTEKVEKGSLLSPRLFRLFLAPCSLSLVPYTLFFCCLLPVAYGLPLKC